MPSLPILKAREIISALARGGFQVVRQRGSHVRLVHADGRRTTVPVHQGEDIDRSLLRKILREAEVLPEDFLKWLK